MSVLRPVPDGTRGLETSPCPFGTCDGSGWIEEADGRARACACLERRKRSAATRRMGTGIPKRFRGVSFDRKPICDLDPMVVRHVRLYVHEIEKNLDAGRGLWFYGDVGTGKTSLAMLVSKAALEAGRSVAIYSMPRLLADIKETYEESSERSYMQLFERLCSVDLLHIDDLGAEKRTDWVLEQVYAIVNERWQEERSMIVTTNLIDVDQLRDQIGARTVSRLHEMCDLIPIMGRDRRMQQVAA
jgi:DNA replication protein DnaC